MGSVDSSNDRTIRLASRADLDVVVQIHLIAYSQSHFTSRLPKHVLKAYYAYFLEEPTRIVLLVQSGVILGFAVHGCGIPEKIAKFKREYFWSMFLVGFARPVSTLRKVINHFLMRFSNNPQFTNPAPYLLLSIAVANSGLGVGSALIDQMTHVALSENHSVMGLYVNTDNISAINTYVKKGFLFKALVQNQYYMERNLGSTLEEVI